MSEHPSTVADTLDAAADLLSGPGKWGTDFFVAQTDGLGRYGVPGNDWPSGNVCYCMLGAIAKVRGDETVPSYGSLKDYTRLLGFEYPADAAQWNDSHSQPEVVAFLREAAAKARGEVQP